MDAAHEIDFHTIFFDEGQIIKNHNSKTHRAARKLKATCHWIVSGTPILDKTQELFAYAGILRIPEVTTLKKFEEEFMTSSDQAEAKIQTIMNAVTINRRPENMLFGGNIGPLS